MRVYDNNYVHIILIPNEIYCVFTFRLIISITTIILIALIIRHYNILLRFLKQQNKLILTLLYICRTYFDVT